MSKLSKLSEPSLFDLIEIEEDKEAKICEHRHEEKSFTFWQHLKEERMTWTCKACGNVRGRCTNL